MKVCVLGLALGLTVACGASGLESMAIGTELVGKGLKAAKEANELMQRDRPQAAVIVMRRHLNDIDEAIQTIKNDPVITKRDKAKVLAELDKYRRGHQHDLERFRAYANMHSELSER